MLFKRGIEISSEKAQLNRLRNRAMRVVVNSKLSVFLLQKNKHEIKKPHKFCPNLSTL